jgi:REP element-mobilizing transposase RayT
MVGEMPRPPRPQFEDATYHVFTKGNRGMPIFLEPDDFRFFLTLLATVAAPLEWSCHSYCLMTTHYHFIVTTPRPNLAAGMQRLNGRYGAVFNDRHGERGHVFQGRYGSVVSESEEQLLVAFRYVALNPVRAGLCNRPEDWRWSSYAAAVTGTMAPPARPGEVLSLFGSGAVARERLRRFVEHQA